MVRHRADQRDRLVSRIRREIDPLGPADRDGLMHAAQDERPCIGIGAILAQRRAGQRVDVGERHQHREFVPERHQHIRAQHAFELGRRTQLGEALAARADRAVKLTEGHALIGAGLADDSGRHDRACHKSGAAHHRLAAEHRDQPLMGIDAVLQGNDRSFGANDRADRRAGALDIPQLDAKQHDIDGADVRGIVGGLRRRDMHLAAIAFDLEAALPHRRQMRATRDKGDIGTRLGERGAVDRADAAGPDDRDPHVSPAAIRGGSDRCRPSRLPPRAPHRRCACGSGSPRPSRPLCRDDLRSENR